MIGLAIDTPVGHNVCGVNINQTILVLDDEGQIVGPFKSLAEVARFYIDRGEMKQGGKLGTIKASPITQITTDRTTPSVLGLPWTFHQY
jgi:hypothetical protein